MLSVRPDINVKSHDPIGLLYPTYDRPKAVEARVGELRKVIKLKVGGD